MQCLLHYVGSIFQSGVVEAVLLKVERNNLRKKEGGSGLLRYAMTMTDGTKYWPIAVVCQHLLKLEHFGRSLFNTMLPSFGVDPNLQIAQYSKILNWWELTHFYFATKFIVSYSTFAGIRIGSEAWPSIPAVVG